MTEPARSCVVRRAEYEALRRVARAAAVYRASLLGVQGPRTRAFAVRQAAELDLALTALMQVGSRPRP